ncbi:hypothetical protein [Kitasatospora sp. NPDC001175]
MLFHSAGTASDVVLFQSDGEPIDVVLFHTDGAGVAPLRAKVIPAATVPAAPASRAARQCPGDQLSR